jgi:TonB family protein
MKKRFITVFIFVAIVTVPAVCQTNEDLVQQVRETEALLAQTMVLRDFDGFVSFLSHEAVFFSNEIKIIGKDAIAAAWKPFFKGTETPFYWKPEDVAVLNSKTLALSTGSVYDSKGQQTGIFNSVWRLEAGGEWKIIFNKTSEVGEKNVLDAENDYVKLPDCYFKPIPVYPEIARRARIKGVVVVRVVWDEQGRIADPYVIISPGRQFGFDDAALTIIKQWKCTPATLDGTPVAVYGNITVNFTMP